ncbi:MAG: Crp/Fnr family transcriptional regulator [Terracidiphilus sp.]|jgi:CRP-like cAMP-binding protein
MKADSPQGRHFAKLDPASFVADQELIEALDSHSTLVPCESDRVLFRQGEPPAGLYIFHGGAVTMNMLAESGQSLFAVQALPGSVLGLPGLIGNEPYTLSANARAGSEISFVGREEFTALMQSDPHLSLKILQVLAAEVRSARKAIY